MSDLISRSKLIMRLSDYALQESPNDNESTGEQRISKMIYDAIQNFISCVEEQPTAYDINKVVDQLEEIRAKKTCNKEKCDTKDICRICVVDDAIEIVKHGVVSDDVCEWEKGFSGYVGYPAYYSKCCTTNSKGLEMQTHIIADWKFCPYCGKKIKNVGD